MDHVRVGYGTPDPWACDEAGRTKLLTAALLASVKALQAGQLPLFETLDDPRPHPNSDAEALQTAYKAIDDAVAVSADLKAFCFELDFVLRLFRHVAKNNPALREEATSLCATAAKACINSRSGARNALRAVLQFYESRGIGRGAAPSTIVDEKCVKCDKPLGGSCALWGSKKYHKACFACHRCGAALGDTFAIVADQPACDACCRQ